VTPSNVPNSLPIPSDNNIKKNMMDQNGAEGPNSTIGFYSFMNMKIYHIFCVKEFLGAMSHQG
jgi:hypothetical protein